MPRPRKHRCCRRYNADRIFKPQGIPMRDTQNILLSLDEFEALRLCDHDRLDQEAAGKQMGVSRGTVQRLLYEARHKVVEAVLGNHSLIVNLKESEDNHAGLHPDSGKRRPGRPRS